MSAADEQGDPAAVVRRVVAAFNAGDLEDGLALIAPDVVDHVAPPGLPPGRDGWRRKWLDMKAAFPDMRATIEQVVARDDMVSSRYTVHGTHSGEFLGARATGRTFAVLAIDMIRVRDGRVVEHWAVSDLAAMLTQLGLRP